MEKIDIQNFFRSQLKNWPLAEENFSNLLKTKKKGFKVGALEGLVQFNPARAVSTLARVDKTGINKRKCFLCKENRYEEQESIEIIEGWELLVNPFPILPFHFTIASERHQPQELNLTLGKTLAEKLPGMVVFYNDEGAGASAPDHSHFQAVPLYELPLINLINNNPYIPYDRLNLPYEIYSDKEKKDENNYPVNAFFWIDKKGKGKVVIIPRKSHRPDLFFLDPPYRRAVSPGAIDMAGIIVTPFKEDFERIDDSDIKKIYSQVGVTK